MSRRKSDNDERYVIDLCDRVLRVISERQKRFDFLRGDPGRSGRSIRLPVDAYYEALNLVIEYREIQHIKPNTFMDRRSTCSGCNRGEQRRLYDQRRREVLTTYGILLIELDYHLFKHDVRGRLTRNTVDDEVRVRAKLIDYLNGDHKASRDANKAATQKPKKCTPAADTARN